MFLYFLPPFKFLAAAQQPKEYFFIYFANLYLSLINFFYHINLGSDHGLKAQGDGWLLTVALLEGSNLAAVDSTGLSDPYVVFSCNGKTRTSSIKFQKSDPQWNGEFDFLPYLFYNGTITLVLCFYLVLWAKNYRKHRAYVPTSIVGL